MDNTVNLICGPLFAKADSVQDWFSVCAKNIPFRKDMWRMGINISLES